MFQIATGEATALRSQIATLNSGRGQHRKYRPYAFTEHGAIQAANILNRPRAVEMGIYVVRAFVALRGLLSSNKYFIRRSRLLREGLIYLLSRNSTPGFLAEYSSRSLVTPVGE
jgi:ORF6N domain